MIRNIRGWAIVVTGREFAILRHGDRWIVFAEDENLGSYHSPQAALDDLAGGHVPFPSGIDTSSLPIPDDLSEWHQLL